MGAASFDRHDGTHARFATTLTYLLSGAPHSSDEMASRSRRVDRAIATLREQHVDDAYRRWDLANEGKYSGSGPAFRVEYVNAPGERRGHFHWLAGGYLYRTYRLVEEPWPARYSPTGWGADWATAAFRIPKTGQPTISIGWRRTYDHETVRETDYELNSPLTLRDAASRGSVGFVRVVTWRAYDPYGEGLPATVDEHDERFEMAPALTWLAHVIADYLAST